MDRIVDCHAHIFPPLDGAAGFESAALHRFYQQWAMHNHGNQPVRRRSDHRAVDLKPLWAADSWSEAGCREDLNFRVGSYGRFEWDESGESYYIQFLPPSLQEMQSPAEFMVAQMDHAGIEIAVLQNDHIYGNLNDYFTAAIAAFPGRFLGLAQVEEGFAYRDEQLAILERAIQHQGLSGLYFSTAGFVRTGYEHYYDAGEFEPLWRLVEQLRIPVFWVLPGRSPYGGMNEELQIFQRWQERHAAIPSVLVHGLPTAQFADDSERLLWPDAVEGLLKAGRVFLEILYPIAWGGRHEYPYRRAHGHIRQLFDTFGPQRLIWGSDMPNVERYCTYRQSLTYFSEHCDYLNQEEREQIFRLNALSLLQGGQS